MLRTLPVVALVFLSGCLALKVNNWDADEDGWSIGDGDCDDDNSSIYPGADELCDGEDNDCDEQIDNDCSYTS